MNGLLCYHTDLYTLLCWNDIYSVFRVLVIRAKMYSRWGSPRERLAVGPANDKRPDFDEMSVTWQTEASATDRAGWAWRRSWGNPAQVVGVKYLKANVL